MNNAFRNKGCHNPNTSECRLTKEQIGARKYPFDKSNEADPTRSVTNAGKFEFLRSDSGPQGFATMCGA